MLSITRKTLRSGKIVNSVNQERERSDRDNTAKMVLYSSSEEVAIFNHRITSSYIAMTDNNRGKIMYRGKRHDPPGKILW